MACGASTQATDNWQVSNACNPKWGNGNETGCDGGYNVLWDASAADCGELRPDGENQEGSTGCSSGWVLLGITIAIMRLWFTAAESSTAHAQQRKGRWTRHRFFDRGRGMGARGGRSLGIIHVAIWMLVSLLFVFMPEQVRQQGSADLCQSQRSTHVGRHCGYGLSGAAPCGMYGDDVTRDHAAVDNGRPASAVGDLLKGASAMPTRGHWGLGMVVLAEYMWSRRFFTEHGNADLGGRGFLDFVLRHAYGDDIGTLQNGQKHGIRVIIAGRLVANARVPCRRMSSGGGLDDHFVVAAVAWGNWHSDAGTIDDWLGKSFDGAYDRRVGAIDTVFFSYGRYPGEAWVAW